MSAMWTATAILPYNREKGHWREPEPVRESAIGGEERQIALGGPSRAV